MSIYKKKLDKMTWSYSRIHSYEICPYQFYLKYIEKRGGTVSNFYSELGKLMHSVLEKVLDHSLRLEDAALYFIDNLNANITANVKQATMDKAIDACINYLAETEFEMLEGFEIVGVELPCKYNSEEGYSLIGYIDLLLKHKKEGYYVIVDHKSSAYPFKKNGDVRKSDAGNFLSYKRQIYLYSGYVFIKYGKFPKELWWNHFKENKIAKIKFDFEEYKDTENWLRETINKIYDDSDFIPQMSYMQCNILCDFREVCEYREFGND